MVDLPSSVMNYRPKWNGQIRVFQSRHEPSVILVDRADFTRQGVLGWGAVDVDNVACTEAIAAFQAAGARQPRDTVGLLTRSQYVQLVVNRTIQLTERSRVSVAHDPSAPLPDLQAAIEQSIQDIEDLAHQQPLDHIRSLRQLGFTRAEHPLSDELLAEIQTFIQLAALLGHGTPIALSDAYNGFVPENQYGFLIGEWLSTQGGIICHLASLELPIAKYLQRVIGDFDGFLHHGIMGYPAGTPCMRLHVRLLELAPDLEPRLVFPKKDAAAVSAVLRRRDPSVFGPARNELCERLGAIAADAIAQHGAPADIDLLQRLQLDLHLLTDDDARHAFCKGFESLRYAPSKLDRVDIDSAIALVRSQVYAHAEIGATLHLDNSFNSHPLNIRKAMQRVGYPGHAERDAISKGLSDMSHTIPPFAHQMQEFGITTIAAESGVHRLSTLIAAGMNNSVDIVRHVCGLTKHDCPESATKALPAQFGQPLDVRIAAQAPVRGKKNASLRLG